MITGRVVAVIDVLRASTTIAVALGNGARNVVPLESADEVITRAKQFDTGEVRLAGERKMLTIPGFDLGNSPRRVHARGGGGEDHAAHHHQRHRGAGRTADGARRRRRRVRESRGGVGTHAHRGPRGNRHHPHLRGARQALLARGRRVRGALRARDREAPHRAWR